MIGPCADGHFGAIIKTCRDWKLSGDTDWLRRLWPNVRRAMEYAWSPENPDRWDPDATGILSGRQHQTLDMELFEPNSWLGSMYVAALLAASEMAAALGEADFADKTARMARAGAAYIDAELFNGRWFVQKIDLGDKSVLAPFDTGRKAGVLADGFLETYWSDEFGELKYQMGEGCISDQILGQWHAEVAGLGGFLDPAKVDGPRSRPSTPTTSAPTSPTTSTPAATTPSRTKAACSSPLTPRASASRWSPPPTPRRSGPASSICPPRT